MFNIGRVEGEAWFEFVADFLNCRELDGCVEEGAGGYGVGDGVDSVLAGKEKRSNDNREIVGHRREGKVGVFFCGVFYSLKDTAKSETDWTDEHNLSEACREGDFFWGKTGNEEWHDEWSCQKGEARKDKHE